MPQIDTATLIKTIRSIVGQERQIPLHEPEFSGTEWTLVKDCLDSGWVSTAGEYVGKFENNLKVALGAKHVIAVTNGTAALHLCLKLSGVRMGDEVIMPALGFVATANAVSYCGAIPHFVDSEETTMGLDAVALADRLSQVADVRDGTCYNRETGKRIAAIVVVHLFGHAAKLDELSAIAEKYDLQIVEDAAEALGSRYKDQAVGTYGVASALSFNGNKIITTGGGGAIVTNDENIAKQARHLSTTARLPHPWLYQHDEIGYNYRMPNLNAALGCAQLAQLDKFVAEKRTLADAYQKAFDKISGVKFVSEPENSKSNYWLNTILLDPGHESDRDHVLKATNQSGIMTRPAWVPLHHNIPFINCSRGPLPQTESIFSRLVNLPSSAKLGRKFVNPRSV